MAPVRSPPEPESTVEARIKIEDEAKKLLDEIEGKTEEE